MSGFHVQRVRSIRERFEEIETIGGGTYGVVQKCRDNKNQDIMALKRIMILRPDDGFPHNTIREVRLLAELRHENIVQLRYVVQSENEKEPGLYLAFEYCEFDLYALLYMPGIRRLNRNEIFCLIKQFLVALHFCAIHQVVHRDLKPANILVTRKWILKLADFGLARKLSVNGRYSDKVITLWYRPPELLLGCRDYGVEVDIWSAGCILYELITARPLFPANEPSELSQLIAIMALCGSPTYDDWPELQEFKDTSMFRSIMPGARQQSQLRDHLNAHLPPWCEGLPDLLMNMLQMNPRKRITAEEALNHKFIKEMGRDTDPDRVIASLAAREEMHQQKVAENRKRDKEKRAQQNRVNVVVVDGK
jgi:serine/threonine protein kinase